MSYISYLRSEDCSVDVFWSNKGSSSNYSTEEHEGVITKMNSYCKWPCKFASTPWQNLCVWHRKFLGLKHASGFDVVFRKRKNIGKQMYLPPSIKACLPLIIRTLPFYGNPLPHMTTTKPSFWLARAWIFPCILWFASLLLLGVPVSFIITPQS